MATPKSNVNPHNTNGCLSILFLLGLGIFFMLMLDKFPLYTSASTELYCNMPNMNSNYSNDESLSPYTTIFLESFRSLDNALILKRKYRQRKIEILYLEDSCFWAIIDVEEFSSKQKRAKLEELRLTNKWSDIGLFNSEDYCKRIVWDKKTIEFLKCKN